MNKVTKRKSPTVLWLGGGTISPSYAACLGLRISDREKYTAELLESEPSVSKFELAKNSKIARY